MYDTENNLQWKLIEPEAGKQSVPHSRFGHSMNLMKGAFIIFGGEKAFN